MLQKENPDNSSEHIANTLPHAGASAEASDKQNQQEHAGAGSDMSRYVEQLEI